MALSSPPPPPDPPSTAANASVAAIAASTASTATATTRPLLPYARPPNSLQQAPAPNLQPHPFFPPPPRQLPSNPSVGYPQLASRPLQSDLHTLPRDPSQLLYPVASSGRGFLSRPVTLPASRPSSKSPFIFSPPDMGPGNTGYVRSTPIQHALLVSAPGSAVSNAVGTVGVVPGAAKAIPFSSSYHLKVGPPSSTISDNNGHTDLRDRSRDDMFTVIGDRKVRISENASMYTLCRSWLRNGFPEETQPQYPDVIKCLPRPLPIVVQQSDSPGRKEVDKEGEEKDEESIEDIPTKDLLQRHIKRAKRVRSRLREERLQRITRYKTRLALLIPPMAEQQFKNESAAT